MGLDVYYVGSAYKKNKIKNPQQQQHFKQLTML